LLELFECEPEVSDPGVPWVYNQLTFRTRHGSDEVDIVLWMADGHLQLAWRRDGREIISLEVEEMTSLRAELDSRADALVATFRPGVRDLRIQLRPEIRVSWGTQLVRP